MSDRRADTSTAGMYPGRTGGMLLIGTFGRLKRDWDCGCEGRGSVISGALFESGSSGTS